MRPMPTLNPAPVTGCIKNRRACKRYWLGTAYSAQDSTVNLGRRSATITRVLGRWTAPDGMRGGLLCRLREGDVAVKGDEYVQTWVR